MIRPIFRRLLIVFLFFSAGLYWTYLMLRRDSIETSWLECISCHQSTNENQQAHKHLLEDEMRIISNEFEAEESYPLDIRYIPAHIREKLEEELPEGGDWKHMHMLKEMLQSDELSKDIEFEDDFLKAYILGSYYRIDEAFSKILNYLNLRNNHNYFFHNVSFDFTQNPAYRFIFLLPQRRKDGSVTIVIRLGQWDPDEVPLENFKKIMFMIYIQELRNPVSQVSGFSIIYDFAGSGFGLLKFGTPQNIYLLHHVAYEVLALRHVGIHLVNMNFIGNVLVTLSRPFLPKFIEKIFYTHSAMEELLYYYPSSMLPVELGGNLSDYYTDEWLRNANREHGNYPPGGLKNYF